MFIKKQELEEIKAKLKMLEAWHEVSHEAMSDCRTRYFDKKAKAILFAEEALTNSALHHEGVYSYSYYISKITTTYKGKKVELKRVTSNDAINDCGRCYLTIDDDFSYTDYREEDDIASLYAFADRLYGMKHISNKENKKPSKKGQADDK